MPQNVEWEKKYGYYVADFYDGHEASAWFTQEGKWVLTSWEVHFNTLPDPVKIRFMLHILDELMTTTLNMLKKPTGATYYLIDIENSEIDVKNKSLTDKYLTNNYTIILLWNGNELFIYSFR